MAHHVTGVFSNPKSAERAVRDLIERHFAVPAEHEHAEHARKVFAEAGADEVRG